MFNTSSLDSRSATVVFLVNNKGVFYLAPKKDDIHTQEGKNLSGSATKFNGYGGKYERWDGSIYHTAARELEEESGVRVNLEDLDLRAQIKFFWPGNKTRNHDMEVFFFLVHEYVGEPTETETMGNPQLFSLDNAPFKQMMPADEIILRAILNEKIMIGEIKMKKVRGKTVVGDRTLFIKRK